MAEPAQIIAPEALTLRASSLPLAFRCPAAIRRGRVLLNEVHEAADNGTAAHEVLRQLPASGRIDWESVPAIADRYGADRDETRMLAALGQKLWKHVAGSFAGALTEVDLRLDVAPGIALTGHADLLAVSSRALRVGDWKTGRKDHDYSQQLRGYAALALLASKDIDEATSTILWVRDSEVENYTITRPEALRWRDELLEKVVNWDGVYRPGNHCKHCPRSHECEAANALIRRDVAIIADKSLTARAECELELMSPSEIVSALQKADLVIKYAERVRKAIKEHVEAHGDIVADGVRLTIGAEQRRELDAVVAWPILEELGFTDDDFARSMDLRVSRVEKIVAARAGKGNGASAVRQLKARLEESGAVRPKIITKLLEKRQ